MLNLKLTTRQKGYVSLTAITVLFAYFTLWLFLTPFYINIHDNGGFDIPRALKRQDDIDNKHKGNGIAENEPQ